MLDPLTGLLMMVFTKLNHQKKWFPSMPQSQKLCPFFFAMVRMWFVNRVHMLGSWCLVLGDDKPLGNAAS